MFISKQSFKQKTLKSVLPLLAVITFIVLFMLPLLSKPTYGNDWYKDFNMTKVERFSKSFKSNITFYTSSPKPNAPSLTLIHGVGGSGADFKDIVATLSLHYQLFIPDLPGYGLSQSKQNTFLPSKYAQAFAEVLPGLVKKDNIIIGHSMGGNISTQLALNHPELAQKLILIDAAGFINKFSYSQYIATNYATEKVALIEKEVPLLKGLIKTVNEYIPDPTKVLLGDAGRKYILSNNSTIISALAVLDEDLTTVIRKPAPPTHIIWGAKDNAMPVQVAGLLSTLLKTDSVLIFDEGGHSPQKQFPHQVAMSIKQFIESETNVAPRTAPLVKHNKDIHLNCKNKANVNVLSHAQYNNVTIENCNTKTDIHSLVASSLTIKNSQVRFTNLNINNPDAFAFIALESDVAIWGGQLKGVSLGYIEQSNVEIHGTNIYTSNALVVSNEPDTMNVSINQVIQNGRRFNWHGMIEVGF